MANTRPELRQRCAICATLDLLGGRWRAPVLYQLRTGMKRFGELRRLLPNITQRVLTQQLRDLERAGLIRREVHAEVPLRVEYELTSWGASLEPVLQALRDWGERYEQRESDVVPPEPVVRLPASAANVRASELRVPGP
jgi:DNA-binding HxlR family transcriptional regulator